MPGRTVDSASLFFFHETVPGSRNSEWPTLAFCVHSPFPCDGPKKMNPNSLVGVKRRMVLPSTLVAEFEEIARPNTIRSPYGIETCGILAGRVVSFFFFFIKHRHRNTGWGLSCFLYPSPTSVNDLQVKFARFFFKNQRYGTVVPAGPCSFCFLNTKKSSRTV